MFSQVAMWFTRKLEVLPKMVSEYVYAFNILFALFRKIIICSTMQGFIFMRDYFLMCVSHYLF